MKLLLVAMLGAGVPLAAGAQSLDTTFDSNGVPIHYVASGSGAPVVLIHGFSASLEMWGPVRAQLALRYRVIAMDCRGR